MLRYGYIPRRGWDGQAKDDDSQKTKGKSPSNAGDTVAATQRKRAPIAYTIRGKRGKW